MENLSNYFWGFTLIEMLTFLSVIVGGIFALYQWRKNVKTTHAQFVNELIEKIRNDSTISNTIYDLDYDKFCYDDDFHGNLKREGPIDQTLTYFSYLCYLKKNKLIAEREFDFFKYNLFSILHNEHIIDYLYNLYHDAKAIKSPTPFADLLDYANKNGFLDEDFYNPNACNTKNSKYHNRIDFELKD